MSPQGREGELFAEDGAACVDYCGPGSDEIKLLDRSLAPRHGQMPHRLRRLMVALIDDRVCPITVATKTLTEGVSLPFEIILVPSLKRSAYDNVKQQPIIIPYTSAAFRNLAGRVGCPCATRGMEGLTLVARPRTIATIADGQKQTQRNQMAALCNACDALREKRRFDERAGDATLSPLAMLPRELREKARLNFGHLTDEALLDWLEQIEPGDVSEDTRTGATGALARAGRHARRVGGDHDDAAGRAQPPRPGP